MIGEVIFKIIHIHARARDAHTHTHTCARRHRRKPAHIPVTTSLKYRE